MKKNKKQNKFFIKHFDDYHEISSKTHKYLELGCFFVDEYGYCRYFGLFYKGKRPSLSKIMNSLKRKVCIKDKETNTCHYYTGEDVGLTFEDLLYEVKESLKQQANDPYPYND